MLVKTLIICTAFTVAYGFGQFSILHAPNSLVFKGTDKIESGDLESLFAASLGYSIEKSSKWRGLYINDPFEVPRSAICITVDGVNALTYEQLKTQSYVVYGEKVFQVLDAFSHHIADENGVAADVQLSEGISALEKYNQIFGDIKPKPEKSTINLKTGNKSHKNVLQQINLINAIADSADTIKLPTFLSLRLSLGDLLDDSAALTEAIRLLSSSIENLTTSYKKANHGDLLVASLTLKSQSTIRIRRAAGETALKDDNDINVAPEYSENYPIIFNIILWFSVIMIFTLLAISYAIAFMDPGRDSIIYRMTSIRIKKDN